MEKAVDFMAKISLTDIKEFFNLLGLHLTVQAKNCWEYLKVIKKYYTNFTFLKSDVALQMIYLFDNPFSISKRFLIKRGDEEVYAYGETPLTSLEAIAEECQIKPSDVVFELGCGRGRTCFWLRSLIGCSTVGIDYIPAFIERADRIVSKLKLDRMTFRNEDFIDSDFSGGSVFYLYGTCLDDAFIENLVLKLSKLPSGTKIITVSYPLTDYDSTNAFEVMKRFPVTFNWGVGDVFLHLVK